MLAAATAHARTSQEGDALVREIARLVATGRNLDAVKAARALVRGADRDDLQDSFAVASWVCITALDLDCANDVLADFDPLVAKLPRGARRPDTIAAGSLLWSFVQTYTGGERVMRQWVSPDFPDNVADARSLPVVYADLQILAARRALMEDDYARARSAIDKAMAATLSLHHEAVDAPRLLVRLVGLQFDSGDAEQALRTFEAAAPVLVQISENSLLYCEYLQIRATLFGTTRVLDRAAQDFRMLLDKLDHQQVGPASLKFRRDGVFNELLGLEVARGNLLGVEEVLRTHPLARSREEIRARASLANRDEFLFLVVEAFARLAFQDKTEDGLDALLSGPTPWAMTGEQQREVAVFAEAGKALALLRRGRIDEARPVVVAAARLRLSHLQERFRRSQGAAPLLQWIDQVLFEFAVAATVHAPDGPDIDLLVGLQFFLQRSLATSIDDTLVAQAMQPTEDRRRTAQALRTIEMQQADWQKRQLAGMADRLWRSPPQSAADVRHTRFEILATAHDFYDRWRRMQQALAAPGVGPGAGIPASLADVQKLLAPGEALVFHLPALDAVAKVCVRADLARVHSEKLDADALALDAALLRQALTASHPADPRADSQYPAAAAVRLQRAMFGGLEECVGPAKRIHVVAAEGPLSVVPPAALLAELPPLAGDGFDLRSAKWLVRDHAFVRATSLGAFAATRTLSRTRRATLDYLGIGDPVLAGRDLEELPETAEELRDVAALSPEGKARLLLRENATEERFRLQPLSEFDVLHFATHGLVREELPGLPEPALALTAVPGGDALNDGLLTASQIAALPLRARLAVLSACNSARFDPQTVSTGIQGLSTAFAIAGVPAMVASLWPIESGVTRDLIVSFFEAARARPDISAPEIGVADALARAVRRHLDAAETAPALLHPRFWAALVLVGDGAITLGPGRAGVERRLQAFVEVEAAEGGEVVAAAPLEDGWVASALGEWDGRRFASLVQRRATGGAKIWETVDRTIGAGPIAATADGVYAGGLLARVEEGKARGQPVLRRIAADGTLEWIVALADPMVAGTVEGLAVQPDRSALVLFGGLQEEADQVFRLGRISIDGARRGLVQLALPDGGKTARYLSGHVAVSDREVLVALNRRGEIVPSADTVDAFGMRDACVLGGRAEIRFLSADGLDEKRRVAIDRFAVRQALPDGEDWLLVGDITARCKVERQAALVVVRADSTSEVLWQDASPFPTSGRGVRRTGRGIEVVLAAQRTMAVRERRLAIGPVGVPRPDASGVVRDGNEAYLSGEMVSVLLGHGGREVDRDFVAAGLPVVPAGMATIGARRLLFGTVGSYPLWDPD